MYFKTTMCRKCQLCDVIYCRYMIMKGIKTLLRLKTADGLRYVPSSAKTIRYTILATIHTKEFRTKLWIN